MNENVDQIDSMTVGEWLQRLNIPELAPKFAALKVVSI